MAEDKPAKPTNISETAKTWSEAVFTEYLRAVARSTPEQNFIPPIADFPEQIALPWHWQPILKYWRDLEVKDFLPRLGIIGVNSKGEVTLIPQTLKVGQERQSEVDFNRWGELAKEVAQEYDLQKAPGIVIVQAFQDWEKELFTPRSTYQLINRKFEPSLILWVTPGDHRLLARTQDTHFETMPEETFVSARKQLRAYEKEALKTFVSMSSDYRLATYKGLPQENLKRIFPHIPVPVTKIG